jgi:hypothetical protein
MVMRHYVWCRSAFNIDFSNDYMVVYFDGISLIDSWLNLFKLQA